MLIILLLVLVALIAFAVWLSKAGDNPVSELMNAVQSSEEAKLPPGETVPDGDQPSQAETPAAEQEGAETSASPTEQTQGQTAQQPQSAGSVSTSGSTPQNTASDWVQPSGSTVVSVTPSTLPPSETEPPAEAELELVQVSCDQYSIFTGQYMEDGRDELVYDVAAILVTNHSDKFLEIATFTYEIDGREATFVATGLHSGRSAWVLEENRMTATADSNFTYVSVATGFRDDVVSATSKISVSVAGNMMTAKNNTSSTLEEVYVYYKVRHTDGNYLGGITYRVDFGTLEPGASLTKLAGHYAAENAEIVRISWKSE